MVIWDSIQVPLVVEGGAMMMAKEGRDGGRERKPWGKSKVSDGIQLRVKG